MAAVCWPRKYPSRVSLISLIMTPLHSEPYEPVLRTSPSLRLCTRVHLCTSIRSRAGFNFPFWVPGSVFRFVRGSVIVLLLLPMFLGVHRMGPPHLCAGELRRPMAVAILSVVPVAIKVYFLGVGMPVLKSPLLVP
ncbi:hypothetical protein NDU88_003310 [Pleurodeles waltl]|uniref:Uncharacterized protein n=1 Tax=Pleurodeles waltl TaxID=8319 RepID=A0AAV7Q8L4_PLEWA|nr:hypothetical protein NDU88_003310 [Pleurodeles waltl]